MLKKRREQKQQKRDAETAEERRTRLDKRNAYNHFAYEEVYILLVIVIFYF